MGDLTSIFQEAVKGYATIEAAKASADGSAGYNYRPESIADQRGTYYPSGPMYDAPMGGVPGWALIGGGVLLIGAVALIALK